MALPQTENEAKILPDAWDFHGRPALRSASGGWTSAAMILGLDLLLSRHHIYRQIKQPIFLLIIHQFIPCFYVIIVICLYVKGLRLVRG